MCNISYTTIMAARTLPSRTPNMCAIFLTLLLLQSSLLPSVLSQDSFDEGYISHSIGEDSGYMYDDSGQYGWSYYFPGWLTEGSDSTPKPPRAWLSELVDLSIWESSWWTQFSWEPPNSTSSISSSSIQDSFSSYDNSGSEDACSSDPCYNGGSCEYVNRDIGFWTCQCPMGFTGDYCEYGKYVNRDIGFWTCQCPMGFTGDYCEYEDPCFPNPCYNGASCGSYGTGEEQIYYCYCDLHQWTGQHCEIEILPYDACSCSPCLNGATCISGSTTSNQYSCLCRPDYSGSHCETELSDLCSPDPCDFGYCYHNDSTKLGYRCDCFLGYNGTNCQYDYLKPEIYCEAGFSYQIGASQSSRAVYWDLPLVSDNSEIYQDGEVTVLCTPPSGTYFTEGERTVVCKAYDESVNMANCSFNVLITREEVPEISCVGDITRSSEAGQNYAVVTYPAPSISNADTYNCWPSSGSNFRIGENVVTCQAIRAGVSDRCNFIVHVRDYEKPIITCPEDKRVNTAYQANYNQVFYTRAVATDNSGLVNRWCEPDTGSIMYMGTHIVVCHAEDGYGNMESCSFTVAVIDNEPPTISCPGRKVRTMEWDQDAAEVWFLGEVEAWDNSEEQPIVECDPREGYFGIGETEVTCEAKDQADNPRSCTFKIQVFDNQAPTIVCPSDIYVKRPVGTVGTQVAWDLQAWDNTEDSLVIGCSPNKQHIFPYGTTTVSCVAEDASDNRGFCQFNVEVTDYEVPEITCPDDIELETLAGENYNRAQWNEPTYVISGISSEEADIDCNFDAGSQFEIGSHMVECVVTMRSGVSNRCSFFVTIVDTEAPTIDCPTNRIVLSQTGESVTPNGLDVPTYEDNSDNVKMYCNPNLDTDLDIGIWQIACFAIDESGNRDDCTYGINVVGAAVPIDPCEGDNNQCNGNGVCLTTSVASKQYTCECYDGYSGQFCQDTDYDDPCEGPGPDGNYNQCYGRGTCITTYITIGEYRCECIDGWTGDRCEDIDYDDPCEGDRNQCNGNGDCITTDIANEYRCECYDGWTGEDCQETEPETSASGAEATTPAGGSVGGNGGENDIGGGSESETSAQLGTGVVIGASSGGLVFIIIILVIIIIVVVLKNRRSKPAERTLSTHPLATPATPQEDKQGLGNPNYSTSIDRYQLPSLSGSGSPTAPPPNMPPPAYTPMDSSGKKIPPRLPSMNPSALYQGGSVMYTPGGSTTYNGGYEKPGNGNMAPQNAGGEQMYDNSIQQDGIYEEINEIALEPPQYDNPDYIDLNPI